LGQGIKSGNGNIVVFFQLVQSMAKIFIYLLFFSVYLCSSTNSQIVLKIKRMPPGVFVLGGIHQHHEDAKIYTYKRMGEIYTFLKPDVFCVETLQKYADDKSFALTPFDFKRYIIPAAQADNIPIYGIDWWDKNEGERWQKLQNEAFKDTNYEKEAELIGGLFKKINDYFKEGNFKEINSELITKIWEAKNNFKYDIYKKNKKYKFIFDFEEKRNRKIVNNIFKVIEKHPNKRILIGVGIDHKYYIERELKKMGVKVLQVDDLIIQ
jgi:hypothetical protein